VLGATGCSTAEQKEQASNGLSEPSAEGAINDLLTAHWILDGKRTVAGTKAATARAEEAGTITQRKRESLLGYVKNGSTREDATEIQELLEALYAGRLTPEETMEMLESFRAEGGVTAEEAPLFDVHPIEMLAEDGGSPVRFDGKKMHVFWTDRGWDYSVSDAGHAAGAATVTVRTPDLSWSMEIAVDTDTLTIDVDREVIQNLAAPRAGFDTVMKLPNPMVMVFRRDPAKGE
jgi:hypothetical protein